MAVQLSDIESLVRSLLGDFQQTTNDLFVFKASSIFTLTEENVNTISTVLINDVVTTLFTYDTTTNKLTVTAALTEGDAVEVRYTYFPNYSSTEIDNYTVAGLTHISGNGYKTFEAASGGIYPEPNRGEKNLIAMVTAVLIEPDNKTYRLPDITCIAPKDLPTHQKVAKIIGMFKSSKTGVWDIS